MYLKGSGYMGFDGSLSFDTKIDEKGLSKGFANVNKQATSGFSQFGNIAKRGLAAVAGTVVALSGAMAGGIAIGVKYNAEIENYATSFEVMTGSAEKAKNIVADLKKLGAETPFELKDLAKTTQLLMNYGFEAKDAQKKLRLLGDIAQGDAEKMNGIATAYGQMSSAGKVSLEDIKQMIERGFNPLQEISESTGESMASLYDRISKGTISVDEITKSMERSTAAGGKYFQSMEKQSKTFNGMVSTLKDNLNSLIGEATSNISTGMTKDLIPTVLGYVDILNTELKNRGTTGLVNAIGLIFGSAVVKVSEQAPKVVESAFGLIDTFIGALNTNATEIGENGAKIVGQFTTGITTELPKIQELGTKFVTGIANGVSAEAPTAVPKMVSTITDLLNSSFEENEDASKAGANLIASIASGVGASSGQIIDAIANFLTFSSGNNSGTGSPTLDGILKQLGGKLLDKIKEGFSEKKPDIGEVIKALVMFALKTSGLESLWDETYKLGKYMAEGFQAGYEMKIKPLGKLISSTTKIAIDELKKMLKINSPSRYMADEVGKYMALGIPVGFDNNIGTVSKQMQKSVSGVVSSMQRTVAMDATVAGTTKMVYDNAIEKDTNTRNPSLDFKGAIDNAFSNAKVILDKREVGRVLVVRGA